MKAVIDIGDVPEFQIGEIVLVYFPDSMVKSGECKPASGWISVKDRMPVETHSIFWRLIGSKQWTNAMWREQSDKVLVTVSFKDGTRFVTTGETHDGEWYTTVSRTLTPEVTHWMQMPEPPEEVSVDA